MARTADGIEIGKGSGQGRIVSNKMWWTAAGLLMLIVAAGIIFADIGNTNPGQAVVENNQPGSGDAGLSGSGSPGGSGSVGPVIPEKNSEVSSTPIRSNSVEGSAYKGVSFKGLTAKTQEGVVGAENFKEDEAYIARSGGGQGQGRMGNHNSGETIIINLIIPKSKLQNLAIVVDDNLILDNFREEFNGDIKELTVNSYLPASRGSIQVYVVVGPRKNVNVGGDYQRWLLDTEISQPIQGPQKKRLILHAYYPNDDAYYRMNIAIRNYI